MAQIDYLVLILDCEDNVLQELDATIFITLKIENGDLIFDVDRFDVEALNSDRVITYSTFSDDKLIRTIFLRAKEWLEQNEGFYASVYEKFNDEFTTFGKGANDPDSRLEWRAA